MANEPWKNTPIIRAAPPKADQADQTATPAWKQTPTVESANPYGTQGMGVVDSAKKMAGDIGGGLDNFVRMIANGATFGGADALAGKANAATSLDTKGGSTTADQKAASGQAATELGPVLANTGQIAGGLAAGALIPGAAVSTMPRALATGGTLGAGGTVASSYFENGELPSAPAIVAGTLVGMAAGGIGQKIGSIFQQPSLTASAQRNVDVLTRNGIDVTAGQATGKAATLASEGSASGAYDFMERQAQNFSRAALRVAGAVADDGGAISPQAIETRFGEIGAQMNRLVQNNNVQGPLGQQILRQTAVDANDIWRTYANSVEGGPAQIIRNTAQRINQAARTGNLSGQDYQDITSALEASARSNPRLASTAREMRGAIDQAMDTYISATNPRDAGLWQMARRAYSNTLVIKKATDYAGADAANGLITPKALQQATKAIQGTRFFDMHGNIKPFAELARAGVGAMRPIPVAGNAAPAEISRVLGRKILQTGGYSAAGIPGLLAGTAIDAGKNAAMDAANSATSLIPYNNLSPTAAATGGQIGTAIGMAGGQGVNPFAKAAGM